MLSHKHSAIFYFFRLVVLSEGLRLTRPTSFSAELSGVSAWITQESSPGKKKGNKNCRSSKTSGALVPAKFTQ